MDNELLLFDRINVIKDTINKYGEENFYLSFSGGKDSTILHWLIDNYGTYEPIDITFQKFCDLFGENHTYISFMGKVKQLHLRKSGKMTMLQYKWLQNHNEIPKDCYLSECEGEVIAIPKDIYNCLNARGLLGKGEITKTMVEVYIAKKEIEKHTHKRLFNYHPTKEHIAKMNSVPKTYHRKFEGEKLEELVQMKAKGYSNRQLELIYGVSHHCIGSSLKRAEEMRKEII